MQANSSMISLRNIQEKFVKEEDEINNLKNEKKVIPIM